LAAAGSCRRTGLGLVVAGWVEGEFSDEFAGVLGDDPDVEFSDEHEDAGACPAVSDADVVQSAVVAHGEFAVAVDAVFADSEVSLTWMPCRVGIARGRAAHAVAGVWRLMPRWGRWWL
jgi:hypothetical protein